MKYVYSAMLLHNAGKEINETNLSNVLKSAGAEGIVEYPLNKIIL